MCIANKKPNIQIWSRSWSMNNPEPSNRDNKSYFSIGWIIDVENNIWRSAITVRFARIPSLDTIKGLSMRWKVIFVYQCALFHGQMERKEEFKVNCCAQQTINIYIHFCPFEKKNLSLSLIHFDVSHFSCTMPTTEKKMIISVLWIKYETMFFFSPLASVVLFISNLLNSGNFVDFFCQLCLFFVVGWLRI